MGNNATPRPGQDAAHYQMPARTKPVPARDNTSRVSFPVGVTSSKCKTKTNTTLTKTSHGVVRSTTTKSTR